MPILDYDISSDAPLPWSDRAIIHLDLDAFFASVAQLDNPELRGLPVLIGSPGKRGVVAAASYEARKFGVHSAMSSARAKKLCPDAIWVPGDFTRYRQISNAVFEILGSYTPHVLPVSIDEAFCDITPDSVTAQDPVALVTCIQEQVAELGVTCSIGLATNMTVAKIGSDYQKPRGCTIIPPGQEASFLAPLPIRTLSGIGRKTARCLDDVGVHTLGELADMTDTDVVHILGTAAVTLRDRARGIDPRRVEDREPVKSVSNENTYIDDLRQREEVYREIRHLADRVTIRARRKGLAGHTVTLKVRSPDFETHATSKTVPYPIDDVSQLIPLAKKLLHRIWKDGQPIRLMGIGLSNFHGRDEQLSLLDEDVVVKNLDEKRELSKNIDAIREKFGGDSIRRGML